ncbi:uncharacterized protein SEPMUDRAFT_146731 [Sphaerulina musiva SO2202]|uniref:Late endosomal/lysosomal adaptor and MAPK and MTOR activator-domain-containing protein n=1 Tax=Sphaerulina musiva (strain SO2202) TaxID=692275 RepID=N1QMZ0_SPHMS|nr:uncharacterized protein SEPMUDRAFT_146731 [Sphaerulina musiva SO2202]EMF17782.1 hypothetical protein SEPMUDRAFT_146731 [Sphaerulina musiva SO2202]
MGAFCSCLGQRPSSQDGDLDRILNSEQPTYGTIEDSGGVSPRDEEELRRERDALEHITAQAADHMIDINHPSQADLNQGFVDTANHHREQTDDLSVEPSQDQDQDQDDSEEAAWLRGIEEEGTKIQIPQRGTLVMDISLLRNTPQRREVVH